MLNPFLTATVLRAVDGGHLVEAVVRVEICAGGRVPVRAIVPAGDGWAHRVEACARVTVEAVRNRLRAQALEGDPE